MFEENTSTHELPESAPPLDLSFVELVIEATERSEDPTEIRDLIDAWMADDRVRALV